MEAALKTGTGLVIFSTLLTVIYGVVFALIYPLVAMSTAIMSLCALCAIVTCLVLLGLWRLITGARAD